MESEALITKRRKSKWQWTGDKLNAFLGKAVGDLGASISAVLMLIGASSRGVPIVLSAAWVALAVACTAQRAVPDEGRSSAVPAFMRMADGMQWATGNLALEVAESYCYEESARNCRGYGRLYTWEAAHLGCRSLGDGWRLPTDDEWRRMASHYGGIFDDSNDRGRAAYEALLIGGGSGFDALLGGGRAADREYDDLEAHGFYWTASEQSSATAWFYNFGRGSLALYRQPEGEKQMALAVRCVKE